MKPPSPALPALRVAIGLLLCAACFQSGRWYQELSGPATAHVKSDPGNEMVAATHARGAAPAEPLAEVKPLVAAGDPPGEGGDIITPLNVRDPSALVMGPGLSRQECLPPPAAAASEPPARAAKPRKLREGRLLELLKKDDKTSSPPKHY